MVLKGWVSKSFVVPSRVFLLLADELDDKLGEAFKDIKDAVIEMESELREIVS